MSGKRDNEELGMVKIYKDGAEVAHYSSGCIIVQAQGFTRNRVVKPILYKWNCPLMHGNLP